MARIESVEKCIREFNPENAVKECSMDVSTMDYDEYLAVMADNF